MIFMTRERMKINNKAFAVFACWFLCSPIQTNKLFSFVRYTFISILYNVDNY